MKKIDLKKKLVDIYGKDIIMRDANNKITPLLISEVIAELLSSPNRKGADLMRCYRLALRIVGCKENEITLDDEEFVLAKKIVEENFMGKNNQTGETIERYVSGAIAPVLIYLEELKG
jgi:hypothetical protein